MDGTNKPRTIIAITLEASDGPWEAFSVWNGQQLYFNRLSPVKSKEPGWREKLAGNIKRQTENNIHVVVEDRVGFVTGPAARLMLNEINYHDGRTNFTVAMDWYSSLYLAGGLAYADDIKPNDKISDEKIQPTYDDRGRPKYETSWEDVKGSHRVILLSILGAMGCQLTPNYLQTFADYLHANDGPPEKGPFSSLMAITFGVTRARMQEINNWDKEENDG